MIHKRSGEEKHSVVIRTIFFEFFANVDNLFSSVFDRHANILTLADKIVHALLLSNDNFIGCHLFQIDENSVEKGQIISVDVLKLEDHDESEEDFFDEERLD